MSTFLIHNGLPTTEEECKKSYEEIKKHFPNYSYERYSKNCITNLQSQNQFLWKAWNESFKEILSPRYMLISRKNPFGKKGEDGLFINVPLTIHILSTFYQDFVKISGQEFEPYAILKEIGDNASLFWERVFQNHYLYGLLLGFGEINSFIYNWENQQELKDFFTYRSYYRNEGVINAVISLHSQKKLTVKDLPLPIFGSYNIIDPVREKYEKERKKIIEELKGKDFTQAVLEYLIKNNNSKDLMD